MNIVSVTIVYLFISEVISWKKVLKLECETKNEVGQQNSEFLSVSILFDKQKH